MKKITYFLASSAAAVLLAAAPMLASAHNDDSGKVSVNTDTKAKIELNWKDNINFLLHGGTAPQHATTTANGEINTSATVTAVNGSTLTVKAKDGAVYTVTTSNATVMGKDDKTITVSQIKVGDNVRIKGTLNGSTVTATKLSDEAVRVRAILSENGAVGAGVVTSVNGSTFTIMPYGTNSTTTVTADGSTVYRVNGELASSSAVAVGSNVILAGTTNGDTSIAASIVGIFTRGFGFFKHVLFH